MIVRIEYTKTVRKTNKFVLVKDNIDCLIFMFITYVYILLYFNTDQIINKFYKTLSSVVNFNSCAKESLIFEIPFFNS